MRRHALLIAPLALALLGAHVPTTRAAAPEPATPAPVQAHADPDVFERGPAFEVNVLWPFFPGGMTDLKVMIPVLFGDQRDWRGEVVVGVHSDFGWRFVRDDDAGRVAILALKVGYRQFLAYGLHLDVTINAGWRHEEDNPWDGRPIDSFQGRLWAFAGYQHEFSPSFYANIRAGVGVHLWRTDRHADKEKLLGVAGDVNLGFRF